MGAAVTSGAGTFREQLDAATTTLEAAGVQTARVDAEWLLAGLLGIGRAGVRMDLSRVLSAPLAERYADAVRRRARREPLQRILGWEDFLGLRIRLTEAESEEPYLTCAVEMLSEISEDILTIEREALMRRAIASFQQLVSLAPHLPAELGGAAGAIDDPLHLAYYIANHIRLTTEQRQEILELDSSKAKLEKLLGHMAHELEVLELGRKIQTQAEEQMGKAQREYFLREQLKAIQRELGELDTEHAELSELRERIEKAELPAEAKREADREIARLERIPSASPESSVIRTYLELIVSLPWNMSTGGEVDVKKAREILDADHYDLDKVKQRIVEHLEQRG